MRHSFVSNDFLRCSIRVEESYEDRERKRQPLSKVQLIMKCCIEKRKDLLLVWKKVKKKPQKIVSCETMSHGFFLSFSKIISGTEFALRTLFWDFWIPFWLFELFRITGVLVQSIINKIQSIWILVPKWPKISVIFDVKIQVQVSWCTHLIRGNFGFVMMNGNTRWHSNSLTHFLQFERKRQPVFYG